jgi:chemotaxis signal transduction protein
MLVRADGCRICVALDAVEGIFDLDGDERRSTIALANGAQVPIVDWGQVTGVASAGDAGGRQVMVLRTGGRLVGLRVDACLGVRSVSLARTPPMPTRLADATGQPLCFLLMLDARPHLMLEPRGLLARVARTEPEDDAGEARTS